jgi:hypothetical protein
VLLSYIISFALTDDILFIEYYGETLEYDRIIEILEDQKRHVWMSYLFRLIFFSIKFLVITLVILVGLFAWNIKLDFKTVWIIVIVSETIFFLNPFMKLVWFGFFDRGYSLSDLNSFNPFSIETILSIESKSLVSKYLLSKMNLLELLYIFVVSFLLAQPIDRSFLGSLKIILSSYGLALFLWTISVSFLLIILTT